jgi:hypothetical protein
VLASKFGWKERVTLSSRSTVRTRAVISPYLAVVSSVTGSLTNFIEIPTGFLVPLFPRNVPRKL